jgi:hypothetical protein
MVNIKSIQLILANENNSPLERKAIYMLNMDILKLVDSETISREVGLTEFFNLAHLPSTIMDELKVSPIFDKYHVFIKDNDGDTISLDEDECDEDEYEYVTNGTSIIEKWNMYNRRYTNSNDSQSSLNYIKLQTIEYYVDY